MKAAISGLPSELEGAACRPFSFCLMMASGNAEVERCDQGARSSAWTS